MSVYRIHQAGNDKALGVVYWWRSHRATVISVISTGLLALLGAWRFNPLWLWGAFFVLAIVGALLKEYVAYRDDKDFQFLEKEHAQTLQYQETTTEALTQLLQGMGKRICQELGIDDEKTRITFYGHCSEGFVPLARYSFNPNIQQIGRLNYPDGEGIIWDTWTDQRQRFYAPRKDREARIKQHILTGVSRETIEKFNMIPRCILGLRLDPELGVVIIESDNILKDSHLSTLAGTRLLDPILPVLKTLRPVYSDLAS